MFEEDIQTFVSPVTPAAQEHPGPQKAPEPVESTSEEAIKGKALSHFSVSVQQRN